jgi:hypothetical protein
MPELLAKIHALLSSVILPSLKLIQTSQAEQKSQGDLLNHNLGEFRAEMQIHLAEIRAEIALCRQELEDTMVTLRERDAVEDSKTPAWKRIVH